jgi:hypothetical protein
MLAADAHFVPHDDPAVLKLARHLVHQRLVPQPQPEMKLLSSLVVVLAGALNGCAPVWRHTG